MTTTTQPVTSQTRKPWWSRLLRGLFVGLRGFVQFVLAGWATLAIYYMTLDWGWLGVALAAAFAMFSIWALWWTRIPRMGWAFLGAFAVVLVCFFSQRPSHDRPWRPEVAVMPRAHIDGDRVRLTGYRNFNYRSRHDFDVKYEEREVSLDRLIGADLYIGYWRVGPVGHTFVSFRFDNAPPVCI